MKGTGCSARGLYSERPQGAGFRWVNPAERWRENPARALARVGFSQHLECRIHWFESSPSVRENRDTVNPPRGFDQSAMLTNYRVWDYSENVGSNEGFQEGISSLTRGAEETARLSQRLEGLIAWAYMVFKPKKSMSLLFCKGIIKPIQFKIAEEQLLKVVGQPVKSIGRWYAIPLTDRHRSKDVCRQVEQGLRAIEDSGLPGRLEIWCFQFGLLPQLLWPLQV